MSGNCCNGCAGDEDGKFPGPSRPIAHHYHSTLTNLFKSELLHKKIVAKKPGIIYGDNSLSFIELDHLSSAAALNIQKHVGREFVVTNPDEEILIGVCLPLSEKSVPLLLAVLKLGAAFLPLDPQDPEDLLVAIIHKFRPVMVITDDNGPILSKYDAKSFAEYSKLMSIEEIWLEMDLPPEGDPKWEKHVLSNQIEIIEPPIPTPPHSRPAIVVHTTGVSGNPRGVRIGHMAIINRCLWEWKVFPFESQNVSALTTPFCTAEGLLQIFSSLLKGITLYLFRRNESLNMSSLVNKIHEKKVTRLYFTSNHLATFLSACEKLGKGSEEFRHISFVCCSGDRLIPVETAKIFFSLFDSKVTLVTYYGGPEVCGSMLYNKIKNPKDVDKRTMFNKIVLNQVVVNCNVYILSNYLELTKDGVQGEVCIAGEGVALGYVNMKEEEEEQRFVSNPHEERKNFSKLFRTGDYGRIEPVNGKRCIYLEGRRDTQIYLKGYPLLIEEVQELLKDNDKIDETYLYVYQPDTVRQALLAFILPKRGESVTTEAVREALARNMPECLLPEITILQELPSVPPAGFTNRVISHLLIRLFEEGKRSSFNSWGKVKLSTEKLKAFKLLAGAMYKFACIPIETTVDSLDSSFYQLGGTSLNTLSVLLYLNQKGCPIGLKDWVCAASINELINLAAEKINTKVNSLTTKASSGKKPEEKGKAKDESKNEDQRANMLSDVLSPVFAAVSTLKETYEVSMAAKNNKRECVEILSKCYAEKGTLERFSLIRYADYYQYFMAAWPSIHGQGLCLALTRLSDKRLIACSLSQDFYTLVPDGIKAKFKQMSHILEYQQELKGSAVHKIPHLKDSVYEIAWMGTEISLPPSVNVAVITLLMNENIKLARHEGYTSIFCLASHHFMKVGCSSIFWDFQTRVYKELCIDALNFTVLDDYPARMFEQDVGIHPFRVAPENITTSICWLGIGKIPSATSSMNPAIIDALTEDWLNVKKDNEGAKGDVKKKSLGDNKIAT